MMDEKNRIDIDAAKAMLPLKDLFERLGVSWDRKKSNPRKQDFYACCPFHSEKTPSFHVMNRRGFYFCFGCHAAGDHVSALKQLKGLDVGAAIRELAAMAGSEGVDEETRRAIKARQRKAEEAAERQALRDRAKGMALARRAYEEAWPVNSQGAYLVTPYLKARGIDVDALVAARRFPDCLRENKQPYFDTDTGEKIACLPCMLAPITDAKGALQALHRTYLSPKRPAKFDAPHGGGAKKILGPSGGGTIRLLAPRHGSRTLVIAEGIETALSLAEMGLESPYADIRDAAYWAGVSLGNLVDLPFPPKAERIILAADNDARDPAAARALLNRAAERARRRLGFQGRIDIIWPEKGTDFNDMLMKQKAAPPSGGMG